MLFDAITKAWVRHKLGSRADGILGSFVEESCSGVVPRIADVCRTHFVVNKTHDVFTDVPGCKFVFVHGDPLDSALSVQAVVRREGMEWFHEHQFHLHAGGKFEDLFDKDVLNFSGQIKSWLNARRPNVFVVAYDSLWEKQQELEAFLGFSICLPERRDRSPKTRPAHINEKLFEELRGLVDELGD